MKLVTLVTAVSFVLCNQALALDVEIGTGINYYQKQTDGVWYQEAYPYWMDFESTPLSFGVSDKIGNNRYRAEFVYLGSLFVNAAFVPDGIYNPANTGCVDAGTCELLVLQGRGNTSGIVLSASRDVPVMGIPFYAEAGIFANVHRWQVTVLSTDGSFVGEIARKYQITYGPVLGFGIRYNKVDLGVRYYYLDDSSEGDPITPAHVGAISVMYKVGF